MPILKSPPRKRSQTLAELRALQRLAGAAIMRSLGPGDRMRKRWIDGRPTRTVIGQFIKPNDRLTAVERIELYNRQYWFRLLDCLYDDYPGLRAVMGQRRFHAMSRAYLEHYPSRSFTMRNLGRNLEKFLRESPRFAGKKLELAAQMARFEWAQMEAFDGPARKPLNVDDLLGVDPSKLVLSLQPHITLLELDYPLDDYSISIKRQALRGEASNAMTNRATHARDRRTPLPRRQKVYVAVHRLDNAIYFKRLEKEVFGMLCALRDGRSLADACDFASTDSTDFIQRVKKWFQTWTLMGWFCKK